MTACHSHFCLDFQLWKVVHSESRAILKQTSWQSAGMGAGTGGKKVHGCSKADGHPDLLRHLHLTS